MSVQYYVRHSVAALSEWLMVGAFFLFIGTFRAGEKFRQGSASSLMISLSKMSKLQHRSLLSCEGRMYGHRRCSSAKSMVSCGIFSTVFEKS